MQPTSEPRVVPDSRVSEPARRSEFVSILFAVDFCFCLCVCNVFPKEFVVGGLK